MSTQQGCPGAPDRFESWEKQFPEALVLPGQRRLPQAVLGSDISCDDSICGQSPKVPVLQVNSRAYFIPIN